MVIWTWYSLALSCMYIFMYLCILSSGETVYGNCKCHWYLNNQCFWMEKIHWDFKKFVFEFLMIKLSTMLLLANNLIFQIIFVPKAWHNVPFCIFMTFYVFSQWFFRKLKTEKYLLFWLHIVILLITSKLSGLKKWVFLTIICIYLQLFYSM